MQNSNDRIQRHVMSAVRTIYAKFISMESNAHHPDCRPLWQKPSFNGNNLQVSINVTRGLISGLF